MEGSCSWETHYGGLDGHAHGNRPEQGRPASRGVELSELLPAHAKTPHVAWMKQGMNQHFSLVSLVIF